GFIVLKDSEEQNIYDEIVAVQHRSVFHNLLMTAVA
ncbi:hypothetical protein TNCV_436431, partial [Trichonephila clavipes]